MSGYTISILRADHLDARVETHDWPFARDNSARIDAHWNKLCEQRPALYNGRVLPMRDWRIVNVGEQQTLQSRHFETDFKAFIGWRDFGFADTSVRNCFSMAALRSADGAFLLGEMGAHTSNAGKIYFPAGTPDPGDIRGEQLDLAGSALRELEEETGIGAQDVHPSDGWSIVDAGPKLGCMKLVEACDSAEAIQARIHAFLAREEKPELARMHVVRTRADFDAARMPDFMIAWLDAMLPR